jgi:hypothetical protein
MKKLSNFFQGIRQQISHLFIPKEENNYRSKALHTDFLTYYLIFALLLTVGFKKITSTNVLGFATDITVEKLYQLTNEQRQKNGLKPLAYNDKLAQAAAKKAADMFAKNYWAHYAPDGASPWDFILSSGYKYEFAGENLAKNFLFSQSVVDAWMNSPSHRENILKPEYSDVGYAIVNGVLNGEETTLVVQMFGKPLLASNVANNPVMPLAKPVQAQPASEKIVTKPKTQLNPTKVSLNINYIFLIFLSLALIMDFYFSVKLNIIRIGGKNVAHLIFIAFILLGLTLFIRGAII